VCASDLGDWWGDAAGMDDLKPVDPCNYNYEQVFARASCCCAQGSAFQACLA